MADTLEKDVDISTDRDVTRNVERTSATGSDDKGRNVQVSTDNKVDIGEAESVAATLANMGNVGATLGQMLVSQAIRHNEELFDRRVRREDELSVIRQRQLSNSADYDQTMRETNVSLIKSRNSQDVKHADLAADRQWNIDEQGYQIEEIVKALSVNNTIVADVLAKLAAK